VRRHYDAGLRKRAKYGIGVTIKHVKQDASWPVRLPTPTLPMSQCSETDTERSGELGCTLGSGLAFCVKAVGRLRVDNHHAWPTAALMLDRFEQSSSYAPESCFSTSFNLHE
jgi:hypothetical protein